MTALPAHRLPENVVARLAVVVYHSSPLQEPGVGDAGGMTIFVRALARSLANRGIVTDIFTRATGDEPRITTLYPGVRVVALEAGPRADLPKDELEHHVEEFVAGVRSFAVAQRVSYDVIHSHYWNSGLAAMQLARGWGIPFVHSHHTLARVKNGALAPGDQPETDRRIEGERRVIAGADVLVASTSEESEQLAGLYGAFPDRIKTIHPGVDHALFFPGDRAEARAELGLDGSPLILHVGRIQPLKGIDLAIRSLARLTTEVPGTRLLVVGGPSGPRGGAETARLSELAADLGLADQVHFVGPQPHERLPVYYRAADVVVVVSLSESFGLTALEAHACGIPIVATPVGGLQHVVQEDRSGFLVGSRDPQGFAQKMVPLLSDRRLHRRFSMAATGAAMSFSWERAATEFLDLYECLVTEEYAEPCTC